MENTTKPIGLITIFCLLWVLGFCLPPEGYDRIMDEPPTDLSEFVDLVFSLEGLNPETADIHLKRKIRDLIVQAHHQDSGE